MSCAAFYLFLSPKQTIHMKLLTWINKRIAYTKSLKQTILIGLLLAAILVFVLIFLQPFDTYYHQAPNKNLMLAGYGPCVFFPLLLINLVERLTYRLQSNKWFVWNEILFVLLALVTMISASYLYNYLYVNKLPLSLDSWWSFMRGIGSPFVVILAPFWIYMRVRSGIIEKQEVATEHQQVVISGQNKSESFRLSPQDFIYAQSQQNYAVIYFQTEDQQVDKKMIRITLAQLNDQVPSAIQVHRSYLVNLDFLKEVKGNARKRFLELDIVREPIPVSQKYYKNLKNQLSNSSQ
jgi:hypothetical protein